MHVTDFIRQVAEKEGKKQQVNIAQHTETMRIIRDLLREKTGIDLYKVIWKIK